MSARRKARKRALDVLYAADIRGVDILEVLAEQAQRERQDPAQFHPGDYATTLIEGVAHHLEAIDGAISQAATEWPLSRMSAVDRALLRLGCYEVVYRKDIPTAVAVSEAGELAQEYSTDESRNFVQGILGAISKAPETARPDTPAAKPDIVR